jgi:hypothetical protein
MKNYKIQNGCYNCKHCILREWHYSSYPNKKYQFCGHDGTSKPDKNEEDMTGDEFEEELGWQATHSVFPVHGICDYYEHK